MKIGILGGTFDPIHFGHLRCAWEVLTKLDLRQVLFIPSKIPPHRATPSASATDRAHMVELAIQGIPEFKLDPLELLREGPSYSIHTLMALRERYGKEVPLYFILGEDAFNKIDTWFETEKLQDFCHFVVIQRGSTHPRTLTKKIVMLPKIPLEINSTAIRELFQQGHSARFLLPTVVEDYILSKKLYKKVYDPTKTI